MTNVVKVLYKISIPRCKEVNIDGFEFTWLERPEYSDAALPVDHFVHANESVGIGAEVAPFVLQRGRKLERCGDGSCELSGVGCAVEWGLTAENFVLIMREDEAKLLLLDDGAPRGTAFGDAKL